MYMRGFLSHNSCKAMAENLLQFARNVLDVESDAVRAAAGGIDEHFEKAVRMVLACEGAVLVSGIGKAGHIARKVSATLASTGTPSHFLSASDAVHGDLGSIRQGDIVMIFSASGESDEILRLASILKKLSHSVIAITATRSNTLARSADVTIAMGKIEEACPLRLAPSASTTAMLALGDALALTVMNERKFTAEQFAVFHPAGQLGRKLIKVSEAMTFRKGENLPVASDNFTVGQVLHAVSSIKRRSGAVILVNDSGQITGVFTDGDLRRLIQDHETAGLSRPMKQAMHANPKRIRADALASEAMAILRQYRIDELPVVDENDRPVGLIDVQDLVVLRMLDVEGQ